LLSRLGTAKICASSQTPLVPIEQRFAECLKSPNSAPSDFAGMEVDRPCGAD
jgi:hypothetical protein